MNGEVIGHVHGKRGAERSTDADRAPDDAQSELEPARFARHIGDDEREHRTEDRGRHAVEH